jgi:hypothetical protein
LGILDLHTLGEAAVQELQRSSFDINKWLVVGIQNGSNSMTIEETVSKNKLYISLLLAAAAVAGRTRPQ